MIAIIDYKAGNIASVRNVLKQLGQECKVTSNPDEILQADGVVFPGQGRAGPAMNALKDSGLDQVIPKITKPFLGICLGMQLLNRFSTEDETQCLGLWNEQVRKFPNTLKIPHLGWNTVDWKRNSVLSQGIANNSYFYFVHSYYVDAQSNLVTGTSYYGFPFASMMQKDNFYAVQFHPEKSGAVGFQLLRNFCALC